jgi:hypothetical protein
MCQEVRHMTPRPVNGHGPAISAGDIDLDPSATLAGLLRDGRVEAGYSSQDALARDLMFTRSKPAVLLAVMDECVLRRRAGMAEIMHRQLMHLVEQGQRQHIGIQIVPLESGRRRGRDDRETPGGGTGACDL